MKKGPAQYVPPAQPVLSSMAVRLLEETLRRQIDAWGLYQERGIMPEIKGQREFSWMNRKPPGIKQKAYVIAEKILNTLLPPKSRQQRKKHP